MANFEKTYFKYVKPIEGYYVNHYADKGGETYGGIARNIYPDWKGWPIVDEFKEKNGGKIKRNTQIPQADGLVTEFFKNIHSALRIPDIASQSVGDVLFDWCVNTIRSYARSGRSAPVKYTQKILGFTGDDVDGLMGPMTLKAINAADPRSLFEKIIEKRRWFYDTLIKNDPSQEVYRKGWYKRLDDFEFTS